MSKCHQVGNFVDNAIMLVYISYRSKRNQMTAQFCCGDRTAERLLGSKDAVADPIWVQSTIAAILVCAG